MEPTTRLQWMAERCFQMAVLKQGIVPGAKTEAEWETVAKESFMAAEAFMRVALRVENMEP